MPAAPLTAEPPVAGCFGKLPQRGDFVRRDLPSAFVDAWDGWLQAAMTASQAALGADWLERYLVCPVWGFLLGRDATGGTARAGVVAPSVDRVGRYYPLTVAAPAGAPGAQEGFDAWFAAARGCLLDVLDEEGAATDFLARVRALGAPQLPDAPRRLAPDAPPRPVDLAAGLAGSGAGLWWTDGGETVAPATLICPHGFPAPAAMAALLDGDWTRHGWHDAAAPAA
jgi:type VI secretion system protein ImpM